MGSIENGSDGHVEARNGFLLSRFSPIENPSAFLRNLKQEIQESSNPPSGNYELFKAIAKKLPAHNPIGTNERIKELLDSQDESEKRLGEELLLFLNAKTLVRVVNSYIDDPRIDDKSEREDMMGSAMESVIETFRRNPSLEAPIAIVVHRESKEGIERFLSGKNDSTDGVIDGAISQEENDFNIWEESILTKDLIDRALSKISLTDRQKFVLEQRFIEEKTLKEIAQQLGITPQGVQQVFERVRFKLRKAMLATS